MIISCVYRNACKLLATALMVCLKCPSLSTSNRLLKCKYLAFSARLQSDGRRAKARHETDLETLQHTLTYVHNYNSNPLQEHKSR